MTGQRVCADRAERPKAVSAPARTKAGTFLERLDWLRETWAQEVFPDRIHRSGVFAAGSASLAPAVRLDGDLIGGSRLGSPAMSATFTAWIDRPHALDDDGLYRWPLRSALAHVGRDCPFAARMLWTLIRLDFDWHAHAQEAGWGQSEYAAFVGLALDKAKRAYNPRPLAQPRQ